MRVDSTRQDRQERLRALLLTAACLRHRRGQRIEISALAAEHGVSRASAYRWFGDNDRLLAEVIAAELQSCFRAQALDDDGQVGPQRVLRIVDRFLRLAARSANVDPMLRRNPRRILKIVASSAHPVQRTTVQLVEDLLDEERASGHLVHPVSSHELAYAIVRVFEAYLYGTVVVDEERDIDTAMRTISIFLRENTFTPHDRRCRLVDRNRRSLDS